MYNKRIKIFIILIASLYLVCLLRLTQMQLLPDSSLQDEIAKLKLQEGLSRQLKTIRGEILDRKGKTLAADKVQFQLHINYRLSSFFDERVQQAKLLRAAQRNNPDEARNKVTKEILTKLEDLQQIIDKCVHFGLEREDVQNRINRTNNEIWNLRTFLTWVRNGPDPKILEKYNHKINSIPLSVAIADFEKKVPDEDQRLLLISKADDIAEMHATRPLLELKTDDDIFTAQLEFMNTDGIQILAEARRFYPYGPVAAQTIGWVGPATQEADRQLFAGDKLLRYLDDEVCGREDGVEYVCETILRGRRGEVFYDIDGRRINQAETQFGKDVSLTLDIELQKRIEEYLANSNLNPNCKKPTAAVVIEVATGNILALVSMPNFDLNRVRYDYTDIERDPNEPLRNRALNKQFPPGSSVKPLILIAGLEAGKITPDEIIHCPAQKAPKSWPSCWLYNKYPWRCHDDDGLNNARNAIKGSCNIYFSRLADRIEPSLLQQWLFKFGYGHKILLPYLVKRDASSAIRNTQYAIREFRQAQGQISSAIPESAISDFDQLPTLNNRERRLFGIGQANLRATPLQAANAMATIARSGIYKPPRLFTDEPNDFKSDSINLNISPQTLDIIYDGMSAVVNEPGGTANREFAPILSSFAEQDVKVYGKTGSTEEPDNAWFAGFAKDSAGRGIAIAVVIEGGQHGSSDAAPIACDIIQFCIEAEYIGQTSRTTE